MCISFNFLIKLLAGPGRCGVRSALLIQSKGVYDAKFVAFNIRKSWRNLKTKQTTQFKKTILSAPNFEKELRRLKTVSWWRGIFDVQRY